jgi:GDPmannose 4,6-dehydratase
MKTAIITGCNGQDGSYLSDILLSKGYRVIGLSRRRSDGGESRIDHLKNNPNFILEYGDITDSGCLHRLVERYLPDEFFNLAAMSYVGASWAQPALTMQINAVGVVNCLEALRDVKKDTKFYQASTSELYGKVKETPQTELTPHHPRSPYGVAKEAGFWAVVNYRESYGMFAVNGVLFNHESPRRGLEFVTRKITDAVAKIKLSGGGQLRLGNLDSKRDFGHASDYMEAAHLMLQHPIPDDFVIATGKTHSIRELLDVAFGVVNLDWTKYVIQDPTLIRPAEVDLLLGDATKARTVLGWEPKYSFELLIREMVLADLERHQK